MSDRPPTSSDLIAQADARDGRDGRVLVAKIKGEITLHNSPALRGDLLQRVEAEKPKHVVLNLAGVPYMDSSAIAVLVEVLKAVRGGGGKVYLTDLQQRVDGLLHIARLDSIFEMCSDEKKALGELGVEAKGGESGGDESSRPA